MLEPIRPVLYADDSIDDRFIMQEAWRESGIANPLELVEDGDAAIKFLERADRDLGRSTPPPGLIILDIKMPKLNGLEALERIRALPRWQAVPILMLSASLHPGDIGRAYQLGANSFLLKPSSLDELVELVGAFKIFWLKYTEYPPQPSP